MRRFWPRLLKTVLPVALVCGGAGYLYAIGAGSYVSGKQDDGSTLRDVLVWRVPFAMAFWGGGFTLIVEFCRHLWAPTKKDEKPAAPVPNPEADAEKLLLQLLEQAEEAERSRVFTPPDLRTQPAAPPSVTDTPLPAALPSADSQPSPVS